MKEHTVRGDDQSWTSNAAPFECFFHNKVMFPLKIMYIYDEILLSNHSLVPLGWPLNGSSTVFLPYLQTHSKSHLDHN